MSEENVPLYSEGEEQYVSVWDMILPVSPVSGAVYLEPDLDKMPPGTPFIVAIMPGRFIDVHETIEEVIVEVQGAGFITLHNKYMKRGDEVAYWFEIAADIFKEKS